MSKIYIDLGANEGKTLAAFHEWHPSHRIYGYEPNPRLFPHLKDQFNQYERVTLFEQAAWIEDGKMSMFLGHPLSGTIMPGKKPMPGAKIYEIDYRDEVEVETVDFSRWLRTVAGADDDVTLKMDIEGAEYALLEKMIEDRSIKLVTTLICEFHADRFPIEREKHDKLRHELRLWTRLIDWH